MKMEIELTESQAEKVEILKKNDIEVGEAIEMIFEMRETISRNSNLFVDQKIDKATQQKAELEKKLAEVEDELSLFEKLKDASLDPKQKEKIIEKEYSNTSKSYDESVQDYKHKVKWSDTFFKL